MSDNRSKSLSQIVKELMDNKHIDDNTSSLVDLKTLLSSADSRQLEELLRQIDVNQFCNDLNQMDDHKDMNLIISIFDVVFESLSPEVILTKFSKEIINGLDAKNELIVDLWLKTLDRCLTNELTLKRQINPELDIHLVLVKVVKLISRPKTLTAKYCHSIVLNIAKSNDIGEKFFDREIQNLLISIKKTDDIIRLRVYELLISVANTSHTNFCKVEGFGHLNDLLHDFNKDSANDPLVTLNILEVIKELATTSYGTNYLKSSNILQTVAERINTSDNDIFGNLLVPGYIKLFGTLAIHEPTLLDKYPSVLTKLKQFLQELDPTIKICAIDTIALICSRNGGRVVINKDSELPQVYMSIISVLIMSGSPELKSKALIALSVLLTVTEPDPHNIGTGFAEAWYRRLLDENRLATLIHLCREPFLEVKLAALECVKVLAQHLWGQKELATTPGFLEYILDRSSENTKPGKEAKYAIVTELVRSPFIQMSFTKEAVIQLKAYEKDGPYYVPAETAVSFEGAN